jgi:hypothetical protein
MRATPSRKSWWRNSAAEMFTETGTGASPASCQARSCRHAQHPAADRDDEAGLFGDGHELRRQHDAELGSRQRRSASAPVMAPEASSTWG